MKNLILILLSSFTCLSQEAITDIDTDMKNCLQNANSTADQRNCINNAYDSWDKLLNTEYQNLINKLRKEEKELFIASQRTWIKYRDAEFSFINSYYYDNDKGTLFFVMGDHKRMEMIKNRTKEIQEFTETLDN